MHNHNSLVHKRSAFLKTKHCLNTTRKKIVTFESIDATSLQNSKSRFKPVKAYFDKLFHTNCNNLSMLLTHTIIMVLILPMWTLLFESVKLPLHEFHKSGGVIWNLFAYAQVIRLALGLLFPANITINHLRMVPIDVICSLLIYMMPIPTLLTFTTIFGGMLLHSVIHKLFANQVDSLLNQKDSQRKYSIKRTLAWWLWIAFLELVTISVLIPKFVPIVKQGYISFGMEASAFIAMFSLTSTNSLGKASQLIFEFIFTNFFMSMLNVAMKIKT